MNPLTEHAALTQLKNQLKHNIELQVNDTKAVIDQEFHNLKVSISQQIDNFYGQLSQARQIFSESPHSDQTIAPDFDLNAVPLNLSNKNTENPVVLPFNLSGTDSTQDQVQNTQQNTENALDLTASQQTRASGSVNSTQTTAKPSQNLLRKKDFSPSAIVSQPRQISPVEHKLLPSATSAFQTFNGSSSAAQTTTNTQQQTLPKEPRIKTEIVDSFITPVPNPISAKRVLPENSISSSAKRVFTKQNTQNISDSTPLMNTNKPESPSAETLKSKSCLNSFSSKDKFLSVSSLSTSLTSLTSTSSELPISKLCLPTSNQAEGRVVPCTLQKPKIVKSEKVRRVEKSTCSELSKKSKAKDDITEASTPTKNRSSTKQHSQNNESAKYESRSRSRSSSRSHSRARARSRSRSSSEYSSQGRDASSKRQKSSYPSYREDDHFSTPFFPPVNYHRFIVKSYTCPKANCKMEFQERYDLDDHIINHHSALPYMCPHANCGSYFRTRQVLISHCYAKHTNAKLLDCCKCLKKFKNPITLLNHFIFEHVQGTFVCSVQGCEFKGNYSFDVFGHFADHYTKDGILKDNLVIIPEAYKRHSAGPSAEQDWQARGNDKRLYKVSLNRSKHKYLISTLMCPFKNCDFMCIYKGSFSEYEKHCLDTHKTRWYLCLAPNCRESFDTRTEFADHLRGNHTKNSWYCCQCSFKACDGVDLHEHKILFHCEGIFKCSFYGCNFADSFRLGVIDHYDRKHGDHP